MKKLSLVLLLTLATTSTMLPFRPLLEPFSWRTWRDIRWLFPITKLKHYIKRPTKLDSLGLDRIYVSELLALYDTLDSKRYKELKDQKCYARFSFDCLEFRDLQRKRMHEVNFGFGKDHSPFFSPQFRDTTFSIGMDVDLPGTTEKACGVFLDLLGITKEACGVLSPGSHPLDRSEAFRLKNQIRLINEHRKIVETHLNRVIKEADDHTPAPLSFANKVNPFNPLHPKDKKLIESSEMLTEWYNKFTANCKNCTKLKDLEKDSE